MESAIEIIVQKHMGESFKDIPEYVYTSVEEYLDRMEFRLRCRDGIVSDYFIKGIGVVLSTFQIDPDKPLYICVPRQELIFKNNTAFGSGGLIF
jgi:hypothetical protein